jgi:hypothetical protein
MIRVFYLAVLLITLSASLHFSQSLPSLGSYEAKGSSSR